MFAYTWRHCASKSSAPTRLPALSVAICPAMKISSPAPFTRAMCEYWPSGLPMVSGLNILTSALIGRPPELLSPL
jgi:hypothetical protein